MKAIPLTRIASFSPFVDYLTAGGGNLSRHLDVAGISPEILGVDEALAPLQQACNFINSAADEGGEAIGLKVGSLTPVTSLGLFGQVLFNALTLKDVMERLLEWIPMLNSGARYWVEDVRGSTDLRLCLTQAAGAGRHLIDGYSLMLLIDAVRLGAGPNWRPREIALTAEGANAAAHFEALSEAVIEKDVHHVGFIIPRRFLSMPVKRSGHGSLIDNRPERLLRSLAPAEDFTGSISQIILTNLQRPPGIEMIAAMTGISLRSLQRRFASSGSTYRDLVDRVRFEEATRLLQDPSIPVNEIAFHLGYADPANFTRAFKRWTGISPSGFQDRGELRSRSDTT